MKLEGKVLKRFKDKNTGKIYAPKGTVDIEEYTNKQKFYNSIFSADKERYEELEKQGYVSKGKLVEDKKYKIEE